MRWLIPFLLLCGSAWAQPPNIPGGPPIQCNNWAVYDSPNTPGPFQVIPSTGFLPANNQIYICGFSIVIPGTVPASVGIVYGTGASGVGSAGCTTGQGKVTPAYQLSSTNPGIVDPSTFFRGIAVPAGNNVCITNTAATQAQVIIYYLQVLVQ